MILYVHAWLMYFSIDPLYNFFKFNFYVYKWMNIWNRLFIQGQQLASQRQVTHLPPRWDILLLAITYFMWRRCNRLHCVLKRRWGRGRGRGREKAGTLQIIQQLSTLVWYTACMWCCLLQMRKGRTTSMWRVAQLRGTRLPPTNITHHTHPARYSF